MNIVEVAIVGACVVIAAIAAPIIHQKQQRPDKLQQALNEFQKELDGQQKDKMFTVMQVGSCTPSVINNSAGWPGIGRKEPFMCAVKLDNGEIKMVEGPVVFGQKFKFSELK